MDVNGLIEHADQAEFLDSLYQRYLQDPGSLSPAWQTYFKHLETPTPIVEKPKRAEKGAISSDRLQRLIDAYRTDGHLLAPLNPIALKEPGFPIQLDLKTLGFEPEDLSRPFPTQGLLPSPEAPLEQIIQALKNIYCQHIGFEFKRIQNPALEQWLEQRIESDLPQQKLSSEQKHLILDYLNKSELFESFLHLKYVGQKRFSLEGGETLIPMLALLVDQAGDEGVQEIVLGMAHRGRLNVLSNILNKSYKAIFSEFDENYIPESFEGTGDVKYHKGYSSDVLKTHHDKKIRIHLVPNPSHLESVDAVVEGLTRAKQFLQQDEEERRKIIPILIHGDAALSGQGVVYETLQFSRLPGYATGGTLHIVINNQIGFTTLPRDGRSTLYCTDIARTFGAPVFHVNAEDPESCIRVILLAFEIRQRFHCDVFIDLNCYRKYGHNETDEPAFTQPIEYKMIRQKRPIRELYRNQLIQEGVVEKQIAEALEEEFKQSIQTAHQQIQTEISSQNRNHDLMDVPSEQHLFEPFPTGVDAKDLAQMAERFSAIPSNFQLHPKVLSLVNDRLRMVKENKPIDWGMAEYLAYASLVWQGVPVRLVGQDTARGTFSHRHAIWVDQAAEQEYFPLAHLKEGQGRFEAINSPLSELAALGFEYGYSLGCQQGLTIWEAQFGDFGNGAQLIIDQYIVSGEQKWGQKSGLVLFLPHGYEGQGPEHSSGRLERFLTLAGHDNIQVVNPTTPAQLFHLLRRQILRDIRKPLIVFTPKGLLRYPACVSSLEDLSKGAFQEILDDPTPPTRVNTLAFCSGRVYYDLIKERAKRPKTTLAIIRIEQLYPLHQSRLQEIIRAYPDVQHYQWVQEEPQNMGAWHDIYFYLQKLVPQGMPIEYVGRSRSASPATGSHARHDQEYHQMIEQVFKYETGN